MAKVKVTVKIPSLDSLIEDINTPRYQKLVGNHVVEEMKSFIDKGISPVKGEGKFEAYSGVKDISSSKTKIRALNQKAKKAFFNKSKQKIGRQISAQRGVATRARNNKYPFNVQGEFPDKKASPVNLNLSGNMLKALVFKISGNVLSVGVFDSKEKQKASDHQSGDSKKKLPKRRFIPIPSEGDEFVVSISRGLKDLFVDIIDSILRKSK